MIGVLLIPVDGAIRADLDRWCIERVVNLSTTASLEDVVSRRVRDQEAAVFASPRRRWADVMEAVRAAAAHGAGALLLRFYEPSLTIAVREESSCSLDGWAIGPEVCESDDGEVSKAFAFRTAVREGLVDIARAQRDAWIDDGLKRGAAALARYGAVHG